jgi:flagellar biosynthesis protein FlhF
MQIKQFEGTSMEEILTRVKKTLGDDAVILSTRKQTKKKMGAFTAAVYEVSAAVDVPPAPHKGIRTRGRVLDTVVAVGATAASYHHYTPRPDIQQRPPLAVVGDEAASAAPAGAKAAPAPVAPPSGAVAPPEPPAATAPHAPAPFDAFLSIEKELAPLKEEIASLKGFLELVVKERAAAGSAPGDDRLDRLADEIRSLKRQLTSAPADAVATQAQPDALPAPAPAADPPEADDDWLVRRLVAQGLSAPAGRKIRNAALARCAASGAVTDAELRREAGEYLASLVRVAELPAAREIGPRILAFIGPAGAGKTATVARVGKMLAKRGLRCAAVAVGDPEKGAGLLLRELQLPHGIPVLCARNADDLSRAVAVCYGAQYLLIDIEGDACGREAAARMTTLFRGHADIDFCLTLPADWDATPADRLVSSLSPLPVTYLAFTGIDRSKRNGNMVKAAAAASRPVLFLTADKGPGAVFPARPYMFSRLLLDEPATETRMSL